LNKINKFSLLVFAIIFFSGCSTTGHFKVPEDSKLYIYERSEPVTVGADGTVETNPFFWTAMGIPPKGGIPYRLEKDGQTIKEGKLRANFRVVSIFWPPLAYIYWPVGFNPDVTYDLVSDKQE